MFADAVRAQERVGASFGELNSDGRPLRVVVLPMRGATGTFFLIGRDAGDQREHNANSVRTYSLVALEHAPRLPR